MRKLYMTTAILLLSAAWAVAQSGSATTPQSQSQSTQQPSAAQQGQANETIEGCLSGSAGNFTLTDSTTGKTYALTGDVASLSDHVGHEVQLTGSLAEASPGTPAETGGAEAQASFNVKEAKMISDTCKPK